VLLGIAAEINLANCLTGNELVMDSRKYKVELPKNENNKKFVPVFGANKFVNVFPTKYAMRKAA